MLAVAAVFPLAAMQLWPTARLAELAGNQRDFEYLSGFAATPFHLVNYVAPGLFHRSPTWRPLVWDPFHAMPEESLTYIGLVPLFLAVMTVMREFRRDPAVRLLTILALVTLILGLGPYVPGFRALITCRASRSSGLRRAGAWPRPWRWRSSRGRASTAGPSGRGPGARSDGSSDLAVVWIVVVLGLVELAVLSTERTASGAKSASAAKRDGPASSGGSTVRSGPCLGRMIRASRRRIPSFEQVMAGARQPVRSSRPSRFAPLAVVLQKSVTDKIFVMQRWRIYLRESWETAVLLALLWAVAGMIDDGPHPDGTGLHSS